MKANLFSNTVYPLVHSNDRCRCKIGIIRSHRIVDQANVALLHEKRKGMQEKMGKTEEQMARAVKMAEKRLKGKWWRCAGW